MADFDVVVVGGGPAGSSTMLHLARLRPELAARSLVLERCKHPRDKPCAGAVSASGLDALRAIGCALSVPCVQIDGVRVRYGTTAVEHGRPAMAVVVRRAEFDHALWHQAAGTGARMCDGEKLVGLARDGDWWHLETSSGKHRARVVVGADGTGSAVRRLAGFSEPRRRAHLFVAETIATGGAAASSMLEFDLTCVDDGIEGYYWDFPTLIDGQRAMSRGIYHLNATPRPELRAVLGRMLARRGIDPGRAKLTAYSERGFVGGTAVSQAGVLLAGEAAGIDPITGEGIAQAIVYGRVAAEQIVTAFDRNDFSFDGYGRALSATTMARHLGQSSALAPRVYGHRARQWASFVASSPQAVAAGAKWYEGRPLGFPVKARLVASLAFAFARGGSLAAGKKDST